MSAVLTNDSTIDLSLCGIWLVGARDRVLISPRYQVWLTVDTGCCWCWLWVVVVEEIESDRT